jgi:hypothetical protein
MLTESRVVELTAELRLGEDIELAKLLSVAVQTNILPFALNPASALALARVYQTIGLFYLEGYERGRLAGMAAAQVMKG